MQQIILVRHTGVASGPKGETLIAIIELRQGLNKKSRTINVSLAWARRMFPLVLRDDEFNYRDGFGTGTTN